MEGQTCYTGVDKIPEPQLQKQYSILVAAIQATNVLPFCTSKIH